MIEISTDFIILCEKIEEIKTDNRQLSIKVKEGFVYPHDEKDVIKTFSVDILIAELFRRDNEATIIFNNINQ